MKEAEDGGCGRILDGKTEKKCRRLLKGMDEEVWLMERGERVEKSKGEAEE